MNLRLEHYKPLINQEWGHYGEISDRGLDVLTGRWRGEYIKADVLDFLATTERLKRAILISYYFIKIIALLRCSSSYG